MKCINFSDLLRLNNLVQKQLFFLLSLCYQLSLTSCHNVSTMIDSHDSNQSYP